MKREGALSRQVCFLLIGNKKLEDIATPPWEGKSSVHEVGVYGSLPLAMGVLFGGEHSVT